MMCGSEPQGSSGAIRREVWFVGLALVAMALLFRYAWIPGPWQEGLAFAERTWDIPVSGVSKWFSGWTVGDGQTFAAIAADPLGLDEGWRLKQPAYRFGRAGFGWVAWAASLGQERWVPYGLAIAGAASLVGLFVLASRLRPTLGFSAWLIVINPAVLVAFAGDTAETLGILVLTWGMASDHRWAAVALGTIRPTYLVALAGRWKNLAWGGAAAATMGLLWILRFGYDPTQYGGNFTLPYLGYIDAPSLQSIGLALFATVTAVVGVRHRNWAWILSGGFVICLSGLVVGGAHNGWRAAGMLFVLWAFGPRYSPSVFGRARSRGIASVPA